MIQLGSSGWWWCLHLPTLSEISSQRYYGHSAYTLFECVTKATFCLLSNTTETPAHGFAIRDFQTMRTLFVKNEYPELVEYRVFKSEFFSLSVCRCFFY